MGNEESFPFAPAGQRHPHISLWSVERTPPNGPRPILNGKARCMGHPKCVASNWWLLTADIAQAYLRQVPELTDVAYIVAPIGRENR